MRVWFLLLACLFWCGTAHAQEWSEKTWSQLVREADLIVRARVVRGGMWGAQVEVEQTYAGSPPPGPLTIVGFNDPLFPPEVVEEQALSDGDVVWMFLDRWTGPRFLGEPDLWFHEGYETLPAGTTFAPPSPIMGEIPLRADGVHLRFHTPLMPDPAGVVPRAEWEVLLADLIRVHRQGKPAQTLAAARSCLGPPVDEPLADRFVEPRDAACLGRLLMLGETRWDDRLAAYAASTHPPTRAALGALAVTLDDPRADPLIAAAVLDEVDLVHILTVRSALDGHRDRLGDVIAVLLPASRWSPPPYLPVHPSRIRDPEARLAITRALGALRRPQDEEVFVNELRFANPALLYLLIDSLQGIRPGSWVGPVQEFLDEAERARVTAIFEATHGLAEPAMRVPLEAFIERDDVPGELIRKALWALEAIGDAGTARLVRQRLRPRLTDDVVWDSDTVDIVAAELSLLAAVEGPAARDVAWDVARLYLSWPRQLGDPARRTRWDAFVAERTQRAAGVLPEGSEVALHVVASSAQVDSGNLRGARIFVDAKVPRDLRPDHRDAVASALGVPRAQVRLCGRGDKGHRCYEDRGVVWRIHQLLAAPTVAILGLAGGYGDEPLRPPDRAAAAWMELALERDLASRTDTVGVFRDLVRGKHLRENPPPPPGPMPLPPAFRRD